MHHCNIEIYLLFSSESCIGTQAVWLSLLTLAKQAVLVKTRFFIVGSAGLSILILIPVDLAN